MLQLRHSELTPRLASYAFPELFKLDSCVVLSCLIYELNFDMNMWIAGIWIVFSVLVIWYAITFFNWLLMRYMMKLSKKSSRMKCLRCLSCKLWVHFHTHCWGLMPWGYLLQYIEGSCPVSFCSLCWGLMPCECIYALT